MPASLAPEIANAFALAEKAALSATTPEPVNGCGRVYVCFSIPFPDALNGAKFALKDRNAFAKFWKARKEKGLTRFIYQKTGYYGLANCLYIGYDNADGKANAQALAFSKAFNAAQTGFTSYVEYGAD